MNDAYLAAYRCAMATLSSRFPVRALPALVLASNTISCRPAPVSKDLAGVYVLEQVALDSIPAVILSTSDLTIQVLADTLWLRPAGTGTEAGLRVFRVNPPSSELDTLLDTIHVTYDFDFQMIDSGFALTYRCPSSYVCDPPPHSIGRPSPNGLQLITGTLRERGPLSYRRLTNKP